MLKKAPTYEEALARVDELSARIHELDDMMGQKINQFLNEDGLGASWSALNQRESLGREQKRVIGQWYQAVNDLMLFPPSQHEERHGHPAEARF
ncbi:hypothetical protein KDH_72750 [Dictyobacter sp. S3.2.2.5]|uniref:Uncharacterized protein n=1 Tax=Dictyobacter halimunensis TaxID=3026934 RepID=A0ABQ6G6L8_9CHLR|nr:hypothetical protein KDH_72750 [Dictyobacter sp. S3.2.2.5]